MKIYLVGGAVRDKLLGFPVKERDYVVVGASTEDMLKLGFWQVGKEFPVFIHPKSGEEYALARMERKIQPGYTGFSFDASPEVTLEEDLLRRDLTINAMAETLEGKLIDPYHGKADLEKKILRHVSQAFIEDPVRILRVGRFYARYLHLGFTIAPETIALMSKMVASGEVDALVAERVWKELERALTEKNPEGFFEVLARCQALNILFPEIQMDSPGIKALAASVKYTANPVIRFAVLFYKLKDPQKTLTAFNQRYRVPNHYKQLASITAKHYATALSAKTLSADELLKFFSALDVFRRFQRFENFLIACQIIAAASDKHFDIDWLIAGANKVISVEIKTIINLGLTGEDLIKAIKTARLKKLTAWLASS